MILDRAERQGGVTLTVTVSDAVPPAPVQVSVNPVVALSCEVLRPGFDVPDHPTGATVHDVASVDVQLSETRELYGTVIGPCEPFARISAVGGANVIATLSDALPPGPLHVML